MRFREELSLELQGWMILLLGGCGWLMNKKFEYVDRWERWWGLRKERWRGFK